MDVTHQLTTKMIQRDEKGEEVREKLEVKVKLKGIYEQIKALLQGQ